MYNIKMDQKLLGQRGTFVISCEILRWLSLCSRFGAKINFDAKTSHHRSTIQKRLNTYLFYFVFYNVSTAPSINKFVLSKHKGPIWSMRSHALFGRDDSWRSHDIDGVGLLPGLSSTV
jgi:hypothetical protein